MSNLDIAALVDLIGEMKAQIAPTLAKLASMEKRLKAHGPGRYAGLSYQATIFEQTREQLDMAAVKAKLSHQFLTAHTSEKNVVVLKVTARQLGDDSIEQEAA
jgi:hypothetical protein